MRRYVIRRLLVIPVVLLGIVTVAFAISHLVPANPLASVLSERQLGNPEAVAAAMDRVNPIYIPRNHLVEAALAAATDGDLVPFSELVDVVTRPFDERPGLEDYARPAPPDGARHVTFCGT